MRILAIVSYLLALLWVAHVFVGSPVLLIDMHYAELRDMNGEEMRVVAENGRALIALAVTPLALSGLLLIGGYLMGGSNDSKKIVADEYWLRGVRGNCSRECYP